MRLSGPWRAFFEAVFQRSTTVALPNEFHCDGLRGRVDVQTDTYGVPHIFGDHQDDLFFTQGFVTARDRLFQMDYTRHVARGRLCELVGERPLPWKDLSIHLKDTTTLDLDILLRSFGIERAAHQSFAVHSARAKSILESYSRGVNAFLALRKLPLEYKIFRCTPAPWTPVDSLALIKMIGFELNFAWRQILSGTLLQSANVPAEFSELLLPRANLQAPTILEAEEWRQCASLLETQFDTMREAVGIGHAPGVGSNCVAVSSELSADGHPLLANDTHLAITTPVAWHEVHMRGAGIDLMGFSLAGVPGISIGRTPTHAWGITAAMLHDLDFFLEKFNPQNSNQYLRNNVWCDVQAVSEIFRIRGQQHQKRRIRVTHHGPVLEAFRPAAHQALSVCWTAQQPGRELDALVGIWEAKNFGDFRRALAYHVCPAFNVSYVDKKHIGYVYAGVIPKRRHDTPLRVLEGWTGEWDWQGVVPADENPFVLDPKEGFIVTANNRPVDNSYTHNLGNLFEPPYRYRRMSDLLREKKGAIGFEDLQTLQCDVHAAWALELRDLFFERVGGVERFDKNEGIYAQALSHWRVWNGEATADSSAATIAYTTATRIAELLVEKLAGVDARHAFLEGAAGICVPLVEIFSRPQLEKKLAINFREIIFQGFRKAVDECRDRWGADIENWRWGDMHSFVGRHRFHGTILENFFSLGPEPGFGGPETVNRGDMNFAVPYTIKVAAAMRMIAGLSDPTAYGSVVPGGQSADRFSKNYDDQLTLFLKGIYKNSLKYSSDEINLRHERFLPS